MKKLAVAFCMLALFPPVAAMAQSRVNPGPLPPIRSGDDLSTRAISWAQRHPNEAPPSQASELGPAGMITLGPFSTLIADSDANYYRVRNCTTGPPWYYTKCVGPNNLESFIIPFATGSAATSAEIEWSGQAIVAGGYGTFETGQDALYYECYVEDSTGAKTRCNNTEDWPTILANGQPVGQYTDNDWQGQIGIHSFHGYVAGLSINTSYTLHIRIHTDNITTCEIGLQSVILSY